MGVRLAKYEEECNMNFGLLQEDSLTHSLPEVDRIWGIWGPYCNIPKAIFYIYLRGTIHPSA